MSMSLSTLLICLLAAVSVITIHSLYQRARKRVEVATLKPFDESTSPRWQWLAPEDVGLLLLRIGLVAIMLAIVSWSAWQNDPDLIDGDIVAVVPGTSQQSLSSFGLDATPYQFWLDSRLTPLAQSPGDEGDVRAALQRLQQRQVSGASLYVVGQVDAAMWPSVAPVWSRPIINVATPSEALMQSDPIDLPSSITVVAPEGSDRDRILAAISLWRDANLLSDDVTVTALDTLLDTQNDASGWWIVSNVVVAKRLPMSTSVALLSDIPKSEQALRGVLATRLWHILGESESLRPVAGVSVRAIDPRGMAPLLQSREPSVRIDSAPHWLILLIGLLFAVERVWSTRQGLA